MTIWKDMNGNKLTPKRISRSRWLNIDNEPPKKNKKNSATPLAQLHQILTYTTHYTTHSLLDTQILTTHYTLSKRTMHIISCRNKKTPITLIDTSMYGCLTEYGSIKYISTDVYSRCQSDRWMTLKVYRYLMTSIYRSLTSNMSTVPNRPMDS